MFEGILTLIRNHFGLAFLIGLLCVGIFVYLIIWTHSMYYKVKAIEKLPCANHADKIERLSEASSKIEGLPCHDHNVKIEKQIEKHGCVESSISSINTSIVYMQKSIDSLSQSLQQNKSIIIDPFTQTHSPLSITDIGYDMVKKLGVYEMFEYNWIRIKFLIEENTKSKNPYDIQQFCIEQAVVFPENFLNEEQLNKIKLNAYSTGSSLTSYMKVIAVLARDKYFSENNINVKEVDDYDPSISNTK